MLNFLAVLVNLAAGDVYAIFIWTYFGCFKICGLLKYMFELHLIF
jgi:hypothetical protein